MVKKVKKGCGRFGCNKILVVVHPVVVPETATKLNCGCAGQGMRDEAGQHFIRATVPVNGKERRGKAVYSVIESHVPAEELVSVKCG